jgi:hypothetical protein
LADTLGVAAAAWGVLMAVSPLFQIRRMVDGKDPAWLDPPEVVDVALDNDDFVAWISEKNLGNGVEEFARFDLKSGLWHIGVIEYGLERIHYVRIDPATGTLLDTVERRWDPDVDGYP